MMAMSKASHFENCMSEDNKGSMRIALLIRTYEPNDHSIIPMAIRKLINNATARKSATPCKICLSSFLLLVLLGWIWYIDIELILAL